MIRQLTQINFKKAKKSNKKSIIPLKIKVIKCIFKVIFKVKNNLNIIFKITNKNSFNISNKQINPIVINLIIGSMIKKSARRNLISYLINNYFYKNYPGKYLP